MFAIAVEFLLGTFRGDPDGTAYTGRQEVGEWPPSPMRLFSALVAADGTGERCRVTNAKGAELDWLEALETHPVIHASDDNAAECHHQVLLGRYVVKAEKGPVKGAHQEYVARQGSLVRPGVRVSPRNPMVVYVWSSRPSADDLRSLRQRAARVGYLGTADSPVRVRICDELPKAAPETRYMPSQDGRKFLSVAFPGSVALLDAMYEQWCDKGPAVGRAQFPALRRQRRYRPPSAPKDEGRGKVVAWLRLETPISGRRVSAVTELFKAAVLCKYQQLHGEPPPELHGHTDKKAGYDLARYIALPNVGHTHADGRLFGLALWLPGGMDEVLLNRAADAANSVTQLCGRSLKVGAHPRDPANSRPWAIQPKRWGKMSAVWVSAIPAIHERRGALTLEEVSRWCQHAGLPAPVAFRHSRTPLLPGALDLAPVEVNRPGRKHGSPYSHISLRFAEPIYGPVVVGGGRQRGFGLCAPVDNREVRK